MSEPRLSVYVRSFSGSHPPELPRPTRFTLGKALPTAPDCARCQRAAHIELTGRALCVPCLDELARAGLRAEELDRRAGLTPPPATNAATELAEARRRRDLDRADLDPDT